MRSFDLGERKLGRNFEQKFWQSCQQTKQVKWYQLLMQVSNKAFRQKFFNKLRSSFLNLCLLRQENN